MSIWKIILATLVIYTAGLFTGVLVLSTASKRPTAAAILSPKAIPVFPGSDVYREKFMERMKKDLQLTPEQTKRLETVFDESRERMKTLWEIVSPEVQGELKAVHEKIRHELTSDQREKFEVLIKTRARPKTPSPAGEKPPRDHRQAPPRNAPPRSGEPAPSVTPTNS